MGAIDMRRLRQDRWIWFVDLFITVVFGVFFMIYTGISEWWIAFVVHWKRFPRIEMYEIVERKPIENKNPGFISQTEIEEEGPEE
jgi:hypothetical protein